jgi:hypothetical protein
VISVPASFVLVFLLMDQLEKVRAAKYWLAAAVVLVFMIWLAYHWLKRRRARATALAASTNSTARPTQVPIGEESDSAK